jgi:hypothetical protein
VYKEAIANQNEFPVRERPCYQEGAMRKKATLTIFLGLLILLGFRAPSLLWSQAAPNSQTNSQTVAIRAGRLFDPKSGANLTNQVVLINGDRITAVGPADRVQVPAGAKVIDLSQATVLPGLIDGHSHIYDTLTAAPARNHLE